MAGKNWDRVRTEDRGRQNGWERMEPIPRKSQKKQPATPGCPLCNASMSRRVGTYGAFLSCTRFPACRGTRKIVA